jgi:hypothetical protein
MGGKFTKESTDILPEEHREKFNFKGYFSVSDKLITSLPAVNYKIQSKTEESD